MFTTRQKIKETIEYFVKNSQTVCTVYQNSKFKPSGVSVVMKYTYAIGDMEVSYDKWYVESYEMAKSMGLPGCEHHDKLVRGSGVTAVSKNFGPLTFYGRDANEIINACETGRDIQSCIIRNNTVYKR